MSPGKSAGAEDLADAVHDVSAVDLSRSVGFVRFTSIRAVNGIEDEDDGLSDNAWN